MAVEDGQTDGVQKIKLFYQSSYRATIYIFKKPLKNECNKMCHNNYF